MDNSNLLSPIFSDSEIVRLREGKCLVSDADADEFVVRILTSSRTDCREFQSDLGKWFGLAERNGAVIIFVTNSELH